MLSKTFILVATAASTVLAGPCRTRTPTASPTTSTTPTLETAVTPTLPSTGASDVPAADPLWVLKKIAIGHGIQNYTCNSTDAGVNAISKGALAALYDITPLYPGTPATGLSNITAFNALSTTLLWSQKLPLNLPDVSAADPGTPEQPNKLPEVNYGADIANPFPAGADLQLGAVSLPFIGVHYFDGAGIPTFDLAAKTGLLGVVGKKDNVKAPVGADKGIIGTGAVDWLRLTDTGAGKGIAAVFRVVTAGGSAQPCSVSGLGVGSVPYTAQYWFYGAGAA